METYSIEIQSDQRYLALYRGLDQLTSTELNKILLYQDELCLDEFNYNEDRGTYCPIAVAFGIHKVKYNQPMTNAFCRDQIAIRGFIRSKDFLFNQLKGMSGDFYRENRRADLEFVINTILSDRRKLL